MPCEHHSVSYNKLSIFDIEVGEVNTLSTFVQLSCSCSLYNNVKKHPNIAVGRWCLCILSLKVTPFLLD